MSETLQISNFGYPPQVQVGSGDWFETYTGKAFDFMNPTLDSFCIEDIAHALSCTGRFNGHGSCFYSVAEHSYHISFLLPKHLALAGLLHDGSEAYLTDVVSPIKPHLTGYKPLEDRLMKLIGEKWGFEWPVDPLVKMADVIALSTEANAMIKSKGDTWHWNLWSPTGQRPNKNAFVVWGWTPAVAEEMFLKRYKELTNEVL